MMLFRCVLKCALDGVKQKEHARSDTKTYVRTSYVRESPSAHSWMHRSNSICGTVCYILEEVRTRQENTYVHKNLY